MYFWKASGGFCGPHVGRVVELQEKLVVGKEIVVDFFGVGEVVDGEIIGGGLLGQPRLGGFDEGTVDGVFFGQGKDVEFGWGLG